MKKYLVIYVGSRGILEGKEILESSLNFTEFCEDLLSKKIKELNIEDEDYIEEWCGVSDEMVDDKGNVYREVNWCEEEGYDVYEL